MNRSSLRRSVAPLAVTCAAALILAACGDDDDDDTGGGGGGEGQNLSGTIQIDGSSTVAPLAEAAAELFQQEHSGVRVTVGTSGTGGGFEKFCNGETDISDASRPIKDEETAACQAKGITTDQLVIANDALSVLVNNDNPVTCLTVEQLKQVWAPGSTAKKWSDITGLQPAFGEDLALYGPGPDSGTFDYFTDEINGEEGAQRTDYSNIGEDDNNGLVGVEGTKGGMFYVGFSYFMENEGRVKALEIDGGEGCVAPSMETVQDGTYKPLARELFMYPSAAAMQRPEVRAFLEFMIENEAEITEAAGYIPLTDEQQQASTTKVASLGGGTGG